MNKIKKIGLGLMVISSIWSCSGHRNNNISKAEKIRRHDKMLSDDLKTPEKKEDLLKLKEVLTENIGIQNNHFVFRLSKKEFKKTGLPTEYYDKIQREIKTNNDFIDANQINANELLKDGKLFQAEPDK